jgi:N-acetyl-anhydromuramyl-L-alanine amidase AmpD
MPPKFIVLHATAGTNSLAWLTTDPASAVSIHLLIRKDGYVYRIVEDAGVAYHAGPAKLYPYGPPSGVNVNVVSLGIELENLNTGNDPYPVVQIEAAAVAHARWEGLYGNLPIVSHASIQANKSDPAGFPWETYRQRLEYYRANPQLL